jgi:hypothetical protein
MAPARIGDTDRETDIKACRLSLKEETDGVSQP